MLKTCWLKWFRRERLISFVVFQHWWWEFLCTVYRVWIYTTKAVLTVTQKLHYYLWQKASWVEACGAFFTELGSTWNWCAWSGSNQLQTHCPWQTVVFDWPQHCRRMPWWLAGTGERCALWGMCAEKAEEGQLLCCEEAWPPEMCQGGKGPSGASVPRDWTRQVLVPPPHVSMLAGHLLKDTAAGQGFQLYLLF